ncbi:MAG: hypothetical protein RJA16_876, partial [Planctomycetota bacterium]
TEPAIDAVVFPPFPYLQGVGRALGHGPPALGAQDLSAHEDGAFTGQVSAAMLDDLDARWVIVGHSERRHGLAEPESVIRAKLIRGLEADLKVVFCVGETLAEREGGHAERTLVAQIRSGLQGLDPAWFRSIVVAYRRGSGRSWSPTSRSGRSGPGEPPIPTTRPKPIDGFGRPSGTCMIRGSPQRPGSSTAAR